MAPSTRQTSADHRAKSSVPQGVAKKKKGESGKQADEKWTKKHHGMLRAESKMESQNRDALTRLEKEIEDIREKPDGPRKEISLAGAQARKKALQEKLGIAADVDVTTSPSMPEDAEMADTEDPSLDDRDSDGSSGEHQQNEENDNQTEITQEHAQSSIEGNVQGLDEADDSTEKTICNIPWHIRETSPIEGPDSGDGKAVPIGFRKKGSGRMYLVRYGTPGSCSTRFESNPGSLSSRSEDTLMDVACGKNRIIEKIIQWHKDNGKSVPDGVLSKAQILNVYWDTKKELGSEAEEVIGGILGPRKPRAQNRKPRTPVRCVVYLDPDLYVGKGWGVENDTGLSHETRTTMLTCIGGISREDREVELFNTAVRLENRYRKVFQSTKEPLLAYPRQSSVRLQTPRRSSPRRTPVWDLTSVRGDEEDGDLDDEAFEEVESSHLRKSPHPRKSQQGTHPITEESLRDILKEFTTDLESRIMRKMEDTLVEKVTRTVLERIRNPG